MPTIRPYQPRDKNNVRHVCIECGPAVGLTQGPEYELELVCFCDYYIECEPRNCFVIANEDDEAVGYILCAEDFPRYYERFTKEYLPRAKGFPFALRVKCWGSAWIPRFFVKKYPAHLHINILEGWQRRGLGSQLMDTLTAQLRAEGIPGVMLGVGSHNVKGRSFYNKYGFRRLLRLPGSVMMGLELK